VISIASMLNKHGKGILYFGIRNDGKALGQEVGKRTIRDVSQAISENIEPKIYPKISKEDIESKICIKVEFSGNNKPYYAYGRAYMRVADEDRQLSAKEIEEIILRKNKDKLRWDTEVCEKATDSDISPKKLKSYIRKAHLGYDSLDNALQKLGLISDGKILNAAVLLFGRKPEKFFPNARLRCAVFATTDTHLALDMQDYKGDIFTLIETAQQYILQNIHVGMRLEGLYRVDVPEISQEAFREAIINAFCHRDYREYDSVNIAIFRDRLEIRSPGLLYGGLTIEKIRRDMVSERRNELIADLLHRIHFIEKWGRGISLILSNEPTADFKESGTHFITTFKRKSVEEYVPEKVGEKVTVKVPEKVTVNQRKIIDEISNDNRVTAKQLAEKVGISERKIKENIKKLKQAGILKRIGPDKGGLWEIRG